MDTRSMGLMSLFGGTATEPSAEFVSSASGGVSKNQLTQRTGNETVLEVAKDGDLRFTQDPGAVHAAPNNVKTVSAIMCEPYGCGPRIAPVVALFLSL